MQAAEVKIKGIVQGVGFRPFIHRLVRAYGLKGTIRNTSSGVTMELEGEGEAIRRFLTALPTEAPPLAVIESITSREIPLKGFETFTHEKSILDKKTWLDLPMRYQPYLKINEKLLKLFLR